MLRRERPRTRAEFEADVAEILAEQLVTEYLRRRGESGAAHTRLTPSVAPSDDQREEAPAAD